jgi:hypothetical protein
MSTINRAHKTTISLVGLALMTSLALTACSSDEPIAPGNTSASDTATPGTDTSDKPTDAVPEPTQSVEFDEDGEPIDNPDAVEEFFDNPFDIDFSLVDVPDEIVEAYGQEMADTIAVESARLLYEVRNNSSSLMEERTPETEKLAIEQLRPIMTDGAFEDFSTSMAEDVDRSAKFLTTYIRPDGTITFGGQDYTVDPEGDLPRTTVMSSPRVLWESYEDGTKVAVVDFDIKVTFDFKEDDKTHYVVGTQRLGLVPGSEGQWLIASWQTRYDETGVE